MTIADYLYYREKGKGALFNGKCEEVLKFLPDNCIDAIVTDPPYGISFMSKKWDYQVPSVETWKDCLRVLKPGGYLLSFGGMRTYHRLACNIEDAGFTLHPFLGWLFGSGFPKATNLSKQIDKSKGLKREVVGQRQDILKKQAKDLRDGHRKIVDSYNSGAPERNNGFVTVSADVTAPASEEAKQWDGYYYGLQSLKPAMEPICMAQKPFEGKKVDSVLKHGVGAVNIDGCRVEGEAWKAHDATGLAKTKFFTEGETPIIHKEPHTKGRFPANIIHDGSPEVLAVFPNTKSGRSNGNAKIGEQGTNIPLRRGKVTSRDDDGSASRFFYCAKASKKERDANLDNVEEKRRRAMCGNVDDNDSFLTGSGNPRRPTGKNNHPTVKPIKLMEYLCKLVTPPHKSLILDPFMGSGSTGIAVVGSGHKFMGIEREAEYCEIAKHRIFSK